MGRLPAAAVCRLKPNAASKDHSLTALQPLPAPQNAAKKKGEKKKKGKPTATSGGGNIADLDADDFLSGGFMSMAGLSDDDAEEGGEDDEPGDMAAEAGGGEGGDGSGDDSEEGDEGDGDGLWGVACVFPRSHNHDGAASHPQLTRVYRAQST